MTLTVRRLKQVLHYTPSTGQFVWKQKRGRQAAGSTAGSSKGSGGYVRLMVDGTLYLAHRLIFFYVEGRFPKHDVDHINGNRADNRYKNLRHATRSANNQNRRTPHTRNKAGYLGVSFDPRDGRYYARIFFNGKQNSLGGFSTPEEAHAAYTHAKRLFHPGCTI